MESIRESKTVKILEEIGADPNLNNDDGRTAFMGSRTTS